MSEFKFALESLVNHNGSYCTVKQRYQNEDGTNSYDVSTTMGMLFDVPESDLEEIRNDPYRPGPAPPLSNSEPESGWPKEQEKRVQEQLAAELTWPTPLEERVEDRAEDEFLWEHIRERYLAGRTYESICRLFGVSKDEIWREVKRRGWSRKIAPPNNHCAFCFLYPSGHQIEVGDRVVVEGLFDQTFRVEEVKVDSIRLFNQELGERFSLPWALELYARSHDGCHPDCAMCLAAGRLPALPSSRNSSKTDGEDWFTEVRAAYEAGARFDSCAGHFGVPEEAIRYVAKRDNWKRNYPPKAAAPHLWYSDNQLVRTGDRVTHSDYGNTVFRVDCFVGPFPVDDSVSCNVSVSPIDWHTEEEPPENQEVQPSKLTLIGRSPLPGVAGFMKVDTEFDLRVLDEFIAGLGRGAEPLLDNCLLKKPAKPRLRIRSLGGKDATRASVQFDGVEIPGVRRVEVSLDPHDPMVQIHVNPADCLIEIGPDVGPITAKDGSDED